jgi:hypothetical protein
VEEVFLFWCEQMRMISMSLYGRKLWETMSSHWPTADQQPGATPAEIDFARNWRDTPEGRVLLDDRQGRRERPPRNR